MVGILSSGLMMLCGRAILTRWQRASLMLGSWRPLCRSGSSSFSRGGRRAMQFSRESAGFQRIDYRREQCSPLSRWGMQRSIQISASQATALEPSQAVFFSEIGADRATEHRTDAAWLAAAFVREDALVVPLLENKSLVKHGKAVFLSSSTMKGVDAIHPIFLGLSNADQVPIFAVGIKEKHQTGAIQQVVDGGAEWVDVRRYGPQLQAAEAGILAYARGMVDWHSRSRYCGRCGSKMIIKEGGHAMKCSSETCTMFSYPRMDPAVIMLITSGNYVLLGRQARWDAGRYSLLAGFVEIGESFEWAVAREIKEEAGIDIDVSSVRYVASQPWPFPSSVMVGFTGTIKKRQIELYNAMAPPHGQTVSVGVDRVPEVDEVNSLPLATADATEMEDVRWIHRSFLRSKFLGETLPHGQNFSLPGKYSIAGYLLKMWVTDELVPQWAGADVPTIDIDEGTFKYILIRIQDEEGNHKLVVRGKKPLAYHSDILEAAHKGLATLGLQVEQLGGGKIEHELASRSLHVFGSSQAYGQADHTVTSALLRQSFPLHTISVSWDP